MGKDSRLGITGGNSSRTLELTDSCGVGIEIIFSDYLVEAC